MDSSQFVKAPGSVLEQLPGLVRQFALRRLATLTASAQHGRDALLTPESAAAQREAGRSVIAWSVGLQPRGVSIGGGDGDWVDGFGLDAPVDMSTALGFVRNAAITIAGRRAEEMMASAGAAALSCLDQVVLAECLLAQAVMVHANPASLRAGVNLLALFAALDLGGQLVHGVARAVDQHLSEHRHIVERIAALLTARRKLSGSDLWSPLSAVGPLDVSAPLLLVAEASKLLPLMAPRTKASTPVQRPDVGSGA